MRADKNKILINYMRQCPQIDYMYAVFSREEDNAKLFEPVTEDDYIRTFIDGGKLKRASFIISNYVSYTTAPVSSNEEVSHENLLELEEMQEIIDWFKAKAKNREYPEFGDNIQIEDMFSVYDSPNLIGVDDSMSPPIAKYTLGFVIEYIEYETDEQPSI